MSSDGTMKRIREASPGFKARIAGGFYMFSVLTAVFLELFLGGKLGNAANAIQMSGMVAVTLLCYSIFRAVNKSLSLLAASINLVGLVFEAVRLNPHGINIAIVFHGVFCILIGYLIFRAAFMPRFLGAVMTLAGLGLVDLPVTTARGPSVPLQYGLRPPQRGLGVSVAPGDGRER